MKFESCIGVGLYRGKSRGHCRRNSKKVLVLVYYSVECSCMVYPGFLSCRWHARAKSSGQ
jgi:hypothetical protein